jgi:hypothetical protein
MNEAKPFCISKKEVWEAYKRVKANKGAAGVDDQSIEDFEKRLKKNLYKIWNRMSSGSYFPPPVRTVKIPKKNGGERKLGIPTVADRIAQQVVKARLEPEVELLLLFAVTMTVALGIKAPLDASVFSAAGGAFLLANCAEYPFSIDQLRRYSLPHA